MLANFAFEKQIDRYLANWLIATIDDLTWAQLCLLAAVARKELDIDLPEVEIGSSPRAWSAWGLHQQLRNIGHYGNRTLFSATTQTERAALPIADFDLQKQKLTTVGHLIYEIMELARVPAAEIKEILFLLKSEFVVPEEGKADE